MASVAAEVSLKAPDRDGQAPTYRADVAERVGFELWLRFALKKALSKFFAATPSLPR
jgi:hypothetical protein